MQSVFKVFGKTYGLKDDHTTQDPQKNHFQKTTEEGTMVIWRSLKLDAESPDGDDKSRNLCSAR